VAEKEVRIYHQTFRQTRFPNAAEVLTIMARPASPCNPGKAFVRHLNLSVAHEYNGGMTRSQFLLVSKERAFGHGHFHFHEILPVLCGAVLLCAGTALSQPAPQPQASHPAAIPHAAQSSLAAKDPEIITLQGYEKLLAAHRGKPLLVSFWATWCEPCRDEYPLINELVKQYAPQGITAIGVSLDDDAEMHLVRHFLAKLQPTFPNYRKRMGGVDEFDHGVDPTWPGELPVNFLFAADGKMIARLDGERPRADYENAIRATILASGSSHR
jgi:thiol-disulfide isomerase/thioredoxin